ncbi:hypothetical protein DOTSEDRAFT_86218 [Dothistroma septosporum NZE10]|uniref:Autophagy-related protein 16 domain-containing protein n=1 Tax=Dothistroma septosporum (strain NZE10 / CBS 128990) TaxID=675120 RepID=N1Q011_DOTSN|nr:hypothetical protein DOTSEDRAFT_86218 [Dothistroma septosporum NZE10]
MSDWVEQYTAALDARDAREQAHKPFIDAYTKLADRTAAVATASNTNNQNAVRAQPSSPRPTDTATPSDPADLLLKTLRTDLAATQKARATLQTQVSDLTSTLSALQTTRKQSTTQITQLTAQKSAAERKVRDREEEIRGKARLVEMAQDEMVALQLQLNMAEQRSEKLKQENKELVERWMRRMGEEAERVNRGSGWE